MIALEPDRASRDARRRDDISLIYPAHVAPHRRLRQCFGEPI